MAGNVQEFREDQRIPIRMTTIKKKEIASVCKEKLERCALLVGMENGANIVENCMVALQKVLKQSCRMVSNSISGNMPQRIKSRDLREIVYIHVHSSIYKSQSCKQPKHSER